MPKHYDMAYGDRIPPTVLDALQEFVSPLAANFRIQILSSTTVRGVAGSGSAQASIGIVGLWRWRSTNFDLAISGAAGGRDLYAVCSANEFSETPADTDTTDYNWYLVSTLTGVLPSGNTPAAKLITAYRKIGTLNWTGTAITANSWLPIFEPEVESAFNAYRPLGPQYTGGLTGMAAAQGTTPIVLTTEPRNVSNLTAPGWGELVYIDPAEFIGPRTTKLRLKVMVDTNGTSPAANFLFSIYPVTITAGGSGAQNTYNLGAKIAAADALITAPAASGPTALNGPDFDPPTAGYYALTCAASVAIASGATVRARSTIQKRSFY